MKILHIIPRWIGGGPERAIIEIARQDRLANRNIERRAIVLDTPISAPLVAMARMQGVTVIPALGNIRLDAEIAAADIVEVSYWNHPRLLALLRRPLPAARILIRSAIAGDTPPHILFPELVALADAWVLSAPMGYGASPLAHKAVSHIPSLADMSRLEGFAPHPHEGVRIAYLGSLMPNKLHPDFAEIVSALKGCKVQFDLYGDSSPACTQALQDRLQAHGVADLVTFHGHVENISAALAHADIFAYPLAEGSYVTSEKALQEAMWAGLPPVLLTGTAAIGWIQDGITGFVAQDIDRFSAILCRLSVDETLRKRIGAAARQDAIRQFDPVANSQTMVDIAFRLVAEPKRCRAPLSGATLSGSDHFLQSLGDKAGPFRTAVNSGDFACQPFAHWNIDLLLRGEGGISHYAKSYPEDDTLQQWSCHGLMPKVS